MIPADTQHQSPELPLVLQEALKNISLEDHTQLLKLAEVKDYIIQVGNLRGEALATSADMPARIDQLTAKLEELVKSDEANVEFCQGLLAHLPVIKKFYEDCNLAFNRFPYQDVSAAWDDALQSLAAFNNLLAENNHRPFLQQRFEILGAEDSLFSHAMNVFQKAMKQDGFYKAIVKETQGLRNKLDAYHVHADAKFGESSTEARAKAREFIQIVHQLGDAVAHQETVLAEKIDAVFTKMQACNKKLIKADTLAEAIVNVMNHQLQAYKLRNEQDALRAKIRKSGASAQTADSARLTEIEQELAVVAATQPLQLQQLDALVEFIARQGENKMKLQLDDLLKFLKETLPQQSADQRAKDCATLVILDRICHHDKLKPIFSGNQELQKAYEQELARVKNAVIKLVVDPVKQLDAELKAHYDAQLSQDTDKVFALPKQLIAHQEETIPLLLRLLTVYAQDPDAKSLPETVAIVRDRVLYAQDELALIRNQDEPFERKVARVLARQAIAGEDIITKLKDTAGTKALGEQLQARAARAVKVVRDFTSKPLEGNIEGALTAVAERVVVARLYDRNLKLINKNQMFGALKTATLKQSGDNDIEKLVDAIEEYLSKNAANVIKPANVHQDTIATILSSRVKNATALYQLADILQRIVKHDSIPKVDSLIKTTKKLAAEQEKEFTSLVDQLKGSAVKDYREALTQLKDLSSQDLHSEAAAKCHDKCLAQLNIYLLESDMSKQMVIVEGDVRKTILDEVKRLVALAASVTRLQQAKIPPKGVDLKKQVESHRSKIETHQAALLKFVDEHAESLEQLSDLENPGSITVAHALSRELQEMVKNNELGGLTGFLIGELNPRLGAHRSTRNAMLPVQTIETADRHQRSVAALVKGGIATFHTADPQQSPTFVARQTTHEGTPTPTPPNFYQLC